MEQALLAAPREVTASWEDGGESALAEIETLARPALSTREMHERYCAGARILVVDDEPAIHDFMDRLLSAHHYVVQHASNGAEALHIIAAHPPDVVISDVLMPVMNGIELCRRVRTNPRTALLPVLLLSAGGSTDDKVNGLDAGADEYMTKPFEVGEILARLRALLRMTFMHSQLENAEQVIFSLALAVEAKDSYTAGHIERVSSLSVAIGQDLGLNSQVCAQIHRGGVLHDIGKIGVPDSVLNKPGRLTPEEFEIIKRHPDIGDRICRKLKTLQDVLDLIRHHHERLDGSGYPDGLSGRAISLEARILAVCDVYDALASNRPYRPAMTSEEAIEMLASGVRAGHWDREVVECLRSIVSVRQEGAPPCSCEKPTS